MKNQIVLGSFFGDEGKGATVQWLCKEAIARGEKVIVARYSGGAQCGHRVINNDVEHVCSSFGSGVLLNVPTYLDKNVYIDPISIEKEFDEIYSKTGKRPTIYVNSNCRVTTPFDILANRKDSITLDHGSCGEGIFHTFKRYHELIFEEMNLAYAMNFPRMYINEVLSYYKYSFDDEESQIAIEDFISAIHWLRETCKIVPNDALLHNFVLSRYDTIVWEGSQGLLLDMDYGFMPHCTPSKTGLNGIREEYLHNAEVFLAMRSYLTRHGNGFTPLGEQIIRDNYISLEEPTNDNFGYQGIFKIGVFDLLLLKRLMDRHHFDNYMYHFNVKLNVVVNHLDCIRDKFFYTRDEDSVSSISSSLGGIIEFLKKEIEAIVPITNMYGGYEINNIRQV